MSVGALRVQCVLIMEITCSSSRPKTRCRPHGQPPIHLRTVARHVYCVQLTWDVVTAKRVRLRLHFLVGTRSRRHGPEAGRLRRISIQPSTFDLETIANASGQSWFADAGESFRDTSTASYKPGIFDSGVEALKKPRIGRRGAIMAVLFHYDPMTGKYGLCPPPPPPPDPERYPRTTGIRHHLWGKSFCLVTDPGDAARDSETKRLPPRREVRLINAATTFPL